MLMSTNSFIVGFFIAGTSDSISYRTLFFFCHVLNVKSFFGLCSYVASPHSVVKIFKCLRQKYSVTLLVAMKTRE